MTYRKLLIANILRKAGGKFTSPEHLAQSCYWVSGKKKGKKISPRTLRYVFQTGDDMPAPALDVIAGIAKALNCEPWELLFDQATMEKRLLSRVFSEPASNERMAASWTAPVKSKR